MRKTVTLFAVVCLFCLVLPTAAQRAKKKTVRIDKVVDGKRVEALMWTRADNGKDINWSGANTYCEYLTLAGHDDWRLPTIDELEKLYDPGAGARRRYPHYKIMAPFELSACCPWSSTKEGSDSAWRFDFHGGGRSRGRLVNPVNLRALCVRRSGE